MHLSAGMCYFCKNTIFFTHNHLAIGRPERCESQALEVAVRVRHFLYFCNIIGPHMSTLQHYTVAGHCFAVRLQVPLRTENYAPFVSEANPAIFVMEEVEALPALELEPLLLPRDQGDEAAHVALYTARWDRGDGLCFVLAPCAGHAPSARLLVDRQSRKGWIQIDDSAQRNFAIDSGLMLLYALFTTDRNTLLMHASTVVQAGNGYLFLGVSGTGKSTHSRLWMEALDDVTLLNDDNPVVRVDDDGVARVYGTPWSGKTPCYINRSVPVGAFVDLEQAPQNIIRPLSPPEAYAALLSSASGMKSDSATADHLHNTLVAIVGGAQCWHLRCLPDLAAARLCHDTVAVTLPMATAAVELPNAVLLKAVADMLGEGKQVTLATKGYSMLPFIRGGRDSVRLQRHDRYEVGDVVLAEAAPHCYVLHRIVALEGNRVTLSGDGNLVNVEHCLTDNIAGRVEAIVNPRGRERKVATSRLWRRLPRPVRRVVLGILHRIV